MTLKEIIYCSTYCNKGHRLRDGMPIEHECQVIPPAALRAEMRGDFESAIAIMRKTPVKYCTGMKNND